MTPQPLTPARCPICRCLLLPGQTTCTICEAYVDHGQWKRPRSFRSSAIAKARRGPVFLWLAWLGYVILFEHQTCFCLVFLILIPFLLTAVGVDAARAGAERTARVARAGWRMWILIILSIMVDGFFAPIKPPVAAVTRLCNLISIVVLGVLVFRNWRWPLTVIPRWQCHRCGYMLYGAAGPQCPECGEPFDRLTVEVAVANALKK